MEVPIIERMKKTVIFLGAITVFSLCSCNLFTTGAKTRGIAAPDISVNTDNITVTPTTISSSPYITIIRYNVTDKTITATVKKDDAGNDMKYVVGQITPANTNTKGYLFTDTYIGSGDYFYQYAARYRISNGYSYSSSTSTRYLPDTAPEKFEQRVYSEATEKKMEWDDKAFTLKFAAENIKLSDVAGGREIYNPTNDILNPKQRGADEDPTKNQRRMMVALSKNDGAITRLFPLTLISEQNPDSSTSYYYYVSLRDVLPSAWYDTNLTMEGFTLQERERIYWDEYEGMDDRELRQTNYHWTIPCTEYKVYDKETGDAVPGNIIAIKTNTSEDETFDYTDPAEVSSARSASFFEDDSDSVEAPVEMFRGFTGEEDIDF